MYVKNILPIEFHKFITRRNFDALSDFHYFKHQIILPEIIEKYGELSDDGYFELTKRGGGKLRFDEVYGYEWVIETNDRYRDPEIYNTIPAYSISTIVDELLKYGVYVYVDLTEDGFVGCVTTFDKNKRKKFSFTSGINTTDKTFDNMYDAYKDIIQYTIKSYNWKTLTKKENL